MATGAGDVVARGGPEAPGTVELCVRNKDGFPCLGVIHRLEPDGRIYCTRCSGNARGAIYVKRGG